MQEYEFRFKKESQGFSLKRDGDLIFSAGGTFGANAIPLTDHFRVTVDLQSGSRLPDFDYNFYPARLKIYVNDVDVTANTIPAICDNLRDNVFNITTGGGTVDPSLIHLTQEEYNNFKEIEGAYKTP